MSIRPNVNFLHCRHTSAFSLLEVIAALLLLSIIATGLITAKTQLMRQWQQADRRLDIAEAADKLIENWWTSGTPPVMDQGILKEGYLWATAPRNMMYSDADEHTPPFQIIRFRVYQGMSIAEEKCILEIEMAIPLAPDPLPEADL